MIKWMVHAILKLMYSNKWQCLFSKLSASWFRAGNESC